jgi:hypothetical protein
MRDERLPRGAVQGGSCRGRLPNRAFQQCLIEADYSTLQVFKWLLPRSEPIEIINTWLSPGSLAGLDLSTLCSW